LLPLVACSRSEEPASPPPAAPAAAPAEPGATQAPIRVEARGLRIEDDDATVVVDGFQFFIQPSEPDVFEIDADASQFIGYAPLAVDFGAAALNGTPPVTFTWNFGDGSEPGTGERVSHTFEKTGRIDVFVTGKDAAGDEANVQLAFVIYTREEWAKARNIDVATLPTPTPIPQ
jgi:hypothetical protein